MTKDDFRGTYSPLRIGSTTYADGTQADDLLPLPTCRTCGALADREPIYAGWSEEDGTRFTVTVFACQQHFDEVIGSMGSKYGSASNAPYRTEEFLRNDGKTLWGDPR